jgi:hypothetical protein
MSNVALNINGPLFVAPNDPGIGVPGGFMSSEELILFVEHQVGNIDDQIRSRMENIEARKAYAAKYQEVANKLKEMKHLDGAQQDTKFNELKAELDELALNDPAFKELADKVSAMHGESQTLQSEDGVDDSWLEDHANTVSGMANDITNTIELDMIRLQGLVQQRTQCMTFASNVLAAMNEANKQIISNTRG